MEGYLAEIRMFAGNFAPRGWAFCQGQILSIAQNTALFSLLGTTYGGDGRTTFALPDLRSRTAVGTGQGPGLSSYTLGQAGGVESVTLIPGNLPAHSHTIGANTGPGTSGSPAGNVMATAQDPNRNGLSLYAAAPNASMAATGVTGSSSPLSILQPYLAMNHIICMEGIYPSRN